MIYEIGIYSSLGLLHEGLSVRMAKDLFIGIHKGQIVEVIENTTSAQKLRLKKKYKKIVMTENQLVMPGLVNAHTHLAMTLMRGISDDDPFATWLFEKIIPLENSWVSPEYVKLGTTLAGYECIRFGVTTVNDMYFFPEVSSKVWQSLGLRGVFGMPIVSSETPETKIKGRNHKKNIEDAYKIISKLTLQKLSITPHAPYSVNDEDFKLAVQMAKSKNLLLHTHASETAFEVSESLKTGQSPIQRLKGWGALEKSALAHCVHLYEADIQLMSESQASVVHNPDSNLKLSSGIAPISKYIHHGINVALGTDGSASKNDLSLWGAINLAAKLQKILPEEKNIKPISVSQVLYSATMGGAKALGLENSIGSIEVGKSADLIWIDLNHAHLHPQNRILNHLVYAMTGLEVDTVMVEGKILLKNKKFISSGYQSTLNKVKSWSKKYDTKN